jgi:hypothetical protein
MSIPTMNWDLPAGHLISLLLFICFTIVPSAFWAASLTPLLTQTNHNVQLLIPNYQNSTLIKEYATAESGPSTRKRQGVFTYSVGLDLLGDLLSSAASATPMDGGTRLHKKIDNTWFFFANRSYGVGASVGLSDHSILNNKLALSYKYYELGYMADTRCKYNKTTDYRLNNTTNTNAWIYTAEGSLPDSVAGPEKSFYVGHSMDSIVAVGVARKVSRSDGSGSKQGQLNSSEVNADRTGRNLTRYMGFAAGKKYSFLNNIQCSVVFVPTEYMVSVDLRGRNITVRPLGVADSALTARSPGSYIFKDRIPNTVMRQFALLADDETNLYVSMVGKAFISSITDYRTAQATLNRSLLNTDQIVLGGVENSVNAMVDDMLVAYASAQVMVENSTLAVHGTLSISAFKIGGRFYIVLGFLFNAMLVALTIFEWWRTRSWARLCWFDYSDLRHVAVASSAGGKELGDAVYWSGRETEVKNRVKEIGRTKVRTGVHGGTAILTLDGPLKPIN